MSADFSELIALSDTLKVAKKQMPRFLRTLIQQEGLYAVEQAKTITQQEHIFNTGDYMRNWDVGKPHRFGNRYFIRFFNNLHYAIHLEYGTRGHYVPGYWEGNQFVYKKGFPGGVYMRAQPGHFVMRRAIERTKTTQEARLKRKIDKYFQEAIPE